MTFLVSQSTEPPRITPPSTVFMMQRHSFPDTSALDSSAGKYMAYNAADWMSFGLVWFGLSLCFTQCQWASCQIRKIAGAHAPGMPGTFSPYPQVSDPDMHHGTCVTHVPWCMPGSLISGFLWNRRRGKTFPAFPAHAQPAILLIW